MKTGKINITLVLLILISSFATPVSASVESSKVEKKCTTVESVLLTMIPSKTTDRCTGENEKESQSETIKKWKETKKIDDEQTIIDLKMLAATQRNAYQAKLDTTQNYINDSDTVAWAKGEATLVECLKTHNVSNSSTKSLCREKSINRIENHTSIKQYNLIESWNGTMIASQYVDKVAENESGISESVVTIENTTWNSQIENQTLILANGTEKSVKAWKSNNTTGHIANGSMEISTDWEDSFEDGSVSDSWNVGSAYSVDSTWAYQDGNNAVYVNASGDSEMHGNPHGSDTFNSITWIIEWQQFQSDGLNSAFAFFNGGSYGASIDWSSTGSIKAYDDSSGTVDSIGYTAQPNTPYKFNVSINHSTSTYSIEITYLENGTVAHTTSGLGWGGSTVIDSTNITVRSGDKLHFDKLNYKKGNKINANKIVVNDDNGSDETMVYFDEYNKTWQEVKQHETRLEDNMAKYANRTYEAYKNGTINLSNYVSSYALAQEYSTNYSETGYWSYAVNSLANAGLSTPSLGNTSVMWVTYNNHNMPEKHKKGLIMSQNAPDNGTWKTDKVYNASKIEGMQLLIATDTGKRIELNNTFVISKMTNQDGEEINETNTKEYYYQTTNTSDYDDLQQELITLRQELEAQEPKVVVQETDDNNNSFSLNDFLPNWFSKETFGIPNIGIGLAVIAGAFLIFGGKN